MQQLMKTFGKNGTDTVKVVIPGSNNGNTEALTSEKEAVGGGAASRVSAPADASSDWTGCFTFLPNAARHLGMTRDVARPEWDASFTFICHGSGACVPSP